MERHSDREQVWFGDLNSVTNPKLAADWSKGTPEDRATDTLQAAKKGYSLPGTKTAMKSGTKLGDDFYRIALPLIEQQLAKARIRVAGTLNAIFK